MCHGHPQLMYSHRAVLHTLLVCHHVMCIHVVKLDLVIQCQNLTLCYICNWPFEVLFHDNVYMYSVLLIYAMIMDLLHVHVHVYMQFIQFCRVCMPLLLTTMKEV